MGGSCGCGSKGVMVFSCSGAADTGAITDLVARRLTLEGRGKMACLAQVGAGNEKVIASAREAVAVLVLDGCPVDCARQMIEKAGVSSFKHLRVTDQGFKKGMSPANTANVSTLVGVAYGLLPSKPAEDGGCCG